MTSPLGDRAARSPYVGLRSFRTEDQDRFFGRLQESHEVATTWRANRLTILYGASGVGKTSLLHAGVIPLLDPDGIDILPVTRVSARATPEIRVTNPYVLALISSLAPDRSSDELSGMTILRFLRQRAKKRDRYGDLTPILLAIDQSEDFLDDLSYKPDEVKKFMAGLARALRGCPEVRLLLTVREDRLPALLSYERTLAGRSHARYRLLPFGVTGGMEAVKRPLRGTGRRFGPGVASELVTELRTIRTTSASGQITSLLSETVDPVQIQVVCSALWESLPESAVVITSAHVRRFGDIGRFLAGFCSRTLSAVADEHRVSAARLRLWLLQNFITEFGTRGMAYEGKEETAGMPNAVLRSLEDNHLIKAEHRMGIRWYELQHDRLIEPLQLALPVELVEAAELELADGSLALAERHATQAIASVGHDDLRIHACAERLLGHIARARQRYDLALSSYRTAASLFEAVEDLTAVAQLLADAGRMSIRIGRYADAVSDLRAAAGRAPGDLSVQYALASALWHAGQSKAAVSVLGGILDRDTDMLAALRLRGAILAELGQAEQALADLYRVRQGITPSTLAARALAHALTGRLDVAGQEAADAVANAPDAGPVLFRVARVMQLTGEPDMATSYAARAVSVPLPSHLKDAAQRMLAISGISA
jgi:tetratricopeptide (TPR) repeat protein